MDREEVKRQQEYLLMEVRLTGEDIKAHLCERLDARIEPLEKRVGSLERTKIYLLGLVAGVAFLWEKTK